MSYYWHCILVCSLGVSNALVSWGFINGLTCSFLRFREFFSCYVFKYVLSPLFSSLWVPYIVNINILYVYQESLKLSSFSYIFFCSLLVISSTLSSSIVIHSSVSFSLLLILVYFSFQLLYSSSLHSGSLYCLTLVK